MVYARRSPMAGIQGRRTTYQSTSVNARGALNLYRGTSLPTGTYTATIQLRFVVWSPSGDDRQFLLRASTSGVGFEAYGYTPDGTINGHQGTFGSLGPSAFFTTWGMLYAVCSNVANPLDIGFIPKGSTTPITMTGGAAVGTLNELWMIGLDFFPAGDPANANFCTGTVWDGALTAGELLDMAVTDDPRNVDTSGGSGATPRMFLPMVSAATVGNEVINGYNFTVSGSGATTETDSPY